MSFGPPACARVPDPPQRVVLRLTAKTWLLLGAVSVGMLLAVAFGHAARPGTRQAAVPPQAGAMAVAALGDPVGNTAPPMADAAARSAAEQTAQAAQIAQIAQIAQLEGQLLQLLTDTKRQQAQLTVLRHRLAAAEAINDWLPWLVLGLVAAAAGAVWLALRVRRLQRELAQRAWAPADVEALAARATAGRASASAPLTPPDQRLLSGSAAAQGPEPGPAPQSPPAPSRVPPTVPPLSGVGSRPAESFSMGSAVPPRPVSVDELLDLDQQVDFFRVLGQEQAAIDLLLNHVRATGGTSALPYFKLLEIYRQQGDEEAYERTRERFNLRFNAVAPDWQGDLAAGRCLLDYPDLVARLQTVWSQPARAVADLEALLLRRADLEPFDLPAFHDLLTLHALLRDLPAAAAQGLAPPPARPQPAPLAKPAPPLTARLDLPTMAMPGAAWPPPAKAGPDAEAVDVLLPLGEGPLDITLPRPHLSEPGAARAMLADWVFSRGSHRLPAAGSDALPTLALDAAPRPAKLDLDLSDFAPAPREFTRPAAFTDVDRRRDSRISDLAGFDDSDLLPPSISRR